MKSFIGYLKLFSITHLFFAVFLFLGLGIFSSFNEEQPRQLHLHFIYLCIIATLIQALVFTIISRFTIIEGISFFITAVIVELFVANSLFLFAVESEGYAEGLKYSLLMNASLVAALFITMLIKEYQAQEM